jgi:ribonuclease R
MLNSEALAQLQGLKQQIEATKEHTTAIVKGTHNRYGFAVVGDGREIFIPPDEMLKVLPGDEVAICIRPATKAGNGKGKEGQTVAEIEKLLHSPLDRFVGRVVNKGKAMFVAPDLPDLKRWLFIPPHARNGAKPGDYVECAILRHPIKDGKPSVKVLQTFGNETVPGLENRYCAARAGIEWDWPEKTVQKMASHLAKIDPANDPGRTDLTHLAFVSVDAARTQDIDDALYAEVTQDGWDLYIAVADPTAFLGSLEDIVDNVTKRGSSVYFHGDMVPMLPDIVSQQYAALTEDALRPAVVCKVHVGEDGTVGDYTFLNATIKSRAKLTYAAVDRYVTGHNDELIAHSNPLEALVQAYRALRRQREEHELVMEDRREYRWHLDDAKQIDHIEAVDKLASQHLVEECMIAANRCAAHFLAMADASGPFVVHGGFRADRRKELTEFLQRHRPDLVDVDTSTLAGYRQVLAALAEPDQPLPLRGMINWLLTRAELSTLPSEHMGMALSAYTNFTSPLRKAIDFLVHLQIKALLAGDTAQRVSHDMLERTSRSISRCREATLSAERWLAGNYLSRLAAEGQQAFDGTIVYVNSSGFTVKLRESGLEGFVDLRKDPEKFSYDKWTASLTSTTRRFQLEQQVEVRFSGISEQDNKLCQFTLQPDCGLKAPKSSEDQS